MTTLPPIPDFSFDVSDLRVELDRLTEGAQGVAELVGQLGYVAARTKQACAMSKMTRDLTEAEVAKGMKQAALARGEKEPSEAAITREIVLVPEVRQARTDYIDAQFAEDAWNAFHMAALQRKAMIEALSAQACTGA